MGHQKLSVGAAGSAKRLEYRWQGQEPESTGTDQRYSVGTTGSANGRLGGCLIIA